mmetsp:Transcript_31829/g.65015  ORF Transcript_31829/g.65015 Transcript_31829/m.65015 type:complete len:172 (-) Transcript_31829:139-654(-)|eukprot:CAMPEP_0183307784 /NCGR_PEP_ID=MMETSP0160_2-20130417/19316_1 /TAXON_ID=2839 ORGANISM="Odontella Sinensis, Strain Grunow 1884" /NCGR_SAMPLE_ID=MMETSP0160_2 /ASSEMBLY_ACC=CAM_ASM_000250 /LENGTH=171 /DNA_ID=CAMNT_0025471451 /DNA_START=53 /DNA_END=568 /DNA_ORIENTATION=+
MSFAGTAGRVVRRLAHRDIDWSSQLFKGNPQLSAAVGSFRGWVANAESLAEKYSAPPSAIEFASAKDAVRDKALVEALEELYSSNTPPPETYEWSAEDRADKLQQIEDAKGRLAFNEEMIEDTHKELVFMRHNRTNRDTSGNDVKKAYPHIAEQTEKEIENREWFKDTLAA